MTTKDEALKLAAERVLDAWDYPQGTKEMNRRMRELRAALVEPRATPDVPEVDFGNTSPQGSMSFYVGGKLAHTVGNPVMSFAVSHEPSAWAAAIDTSGQRVEEAADGGHEAAQQQEPASEEDMKVYKAIAANYYASLQPAQQQEPAVWNHDCAALLQNDVELWIDRCPHCGKPRTTPPAMRRATREEKISNPGVYEAPVDMPKIGCVNHDCDQCKAQQQGRTTSYEELERIADDLQALCDKQAIRIGQLEAQQQDQQYESMQDYINSLDQRSQEAMFEQIDLWARKSYLRHRSGVSGQQLSYGDNFQTHVILASLRWAKEHPDKINSEGGAA